MHKKSPYKFNSTYSKFLPFAFITVVFNGKCDIFTIDANDSVVAYGNPMSIFAKVFNY